MIVLGYSVSDTTITIITTTRHYSIPDSHPNFHEIEDILLTEWQFGNIDIPKLDALVDIPTTINTRTSGKVVVDPNDGQVYYDGIILHNAVTQHLLRLLDQGSSALAAWIKFTDKLMLNPSYRSREQLYTFMEANDITINTNGDLLLYKKVRDDYYDVHTGRTYKYTVGSVHEMDRTKVDDDPQRTCSAGIHVAAHSYIGQFGGERVVICAVNPADVVAIPIDYNNAKMRVSRLRVVAEHPRAKNEPTLNRPYMDEADDDQDYTWDDSVGR